MSLNQHIVSGRVGKKPELRYTTNGSPVTSFSLAHTPRRLNQATNTWENGETTWYDVSAFGRLAENVVASVPVGIEVTVTGNLSKRAYTAKDGSNQTAWDLKADDVAVPLDHQVVNIVDKSAYGSKGGRPAAPVTGPAPDLNDDETPF